MNKGKVIQTLKSVLLLAGSFTFSFLLGEFIHDSGHYLCHMAYGNSYIHVHFDPYGGTRIIGASGLPQRTLAVTSAAGPFPHLVIALTTFGLLWKHRRPLLLPLVIWGPVAMIQEGVNFSLGLLTPGGDAAWISTLGISKTVILIVGVLLLIAGVALVSFLLPLTGIQRDDSFGKKFLIVFVGIGILMLVRAIHAYLVDPQHLLENLVPLIFSLILTILVIALHHSFIRRIGNLSSFQATQIHWPVSIISLSLGATMFIIQLFVLR